MHRFHLPTMSCGGCLGAVTRAIRSLDPQAVIAADRAARAIALRSDRPQAALLAVLRAAGFPAEPLTPSAA